MAFPWPCVLCGEKIQLKDGLVGTSVKLLPFLVALPPPRKTRAELMKAIDFEYYGYLDEDDGVIVPLEQEYEKKRMSAGCHYSWHLDSVSPLQMKQCMIPKTGFIVAEGL